MSRCLLKFSRRKPGEPPEEATACSPGSQCRRRVAPGFAIPPNLSSPGRGGGGGGGGTDSGIAETLPVEVKRQGQAVLDVLGVA
jgi:hypothetical protein